MKKKLILLIVVISIILCSTLAISLAVSRNISYEDIDTEPIEDLTDTDDSFDTEDDTSSSDRPTVDPPEVEEPDTEQPETESPETEPPQNDSQNKRITILWGDQDATRFTVNEGYTLRRFLKTFANEDGEWEGPDGVLYRLGEDYLEVDDGGFIITGISLDLPLMDGMRYGAIPISVTINGKIYNHYIYQWSFWEGNAAQCQYDGSAYITVNNEGIVVYNGKILYRDATKVNPVKGSDLIQWNGKYYC